MRRIAPLPAETALSHSTLMKNVSLRAVLRGIHLVFGIPIVGYAYSPFERLPEYAPVVRYVAFPAIFVSGLWMWKGAALRRLFASRPA